MKQSWLFFLAIIVLTGSSFVIIVPSFLQAKDDVRTISFYETHLRETTTITYKRNGRFIPSGMKKVNYALRDWRTGQPTRMNPKLIDTIWELHKELKSTGPVQIISGYRSPKTNAKLRRRGGGQAKRSQHMLGNAMDVRFPGVSTKALRAAAMKKERGGVGYYPSSRFVHVDVARVRSWPRMSRYQLAMLFPYKSTRHRPSSGGRLTRRDRYKARIRLAKLNKGKKGKKRGAAQDRIFLARAKDRKSNGKAGSKTRLALGQNKSTAPLGSKLWVDQGNNKRYAALDSQIYSSQRQVIDAPLVKGKGSAKKPEALKKKISSILANFSSGRDKKGKHKKVAALTEDEADMKEFIAEKVGYAPIYNDEDPEEVAYQPFSLSPYIGGQDARLKEPAYDKLDMVRNNMVFSAKFTNKNALEGNNWSSAFRGKAVRNLMGVSAGKSFRTTFQPDLEMLVHRM